MNPIRQCSSAHLSSSDTRDGGTQFVGLPEGLGSMRGTTVRPCAGGTTRRTRTHRTRPAGATAGRPMPALQAIDLLPGASIGRRAAGRAGLDRRAPVRAIRAEHTAVADQRTQHRLATLALVEPLAGVHRHRLLFRVAAQRTGENRLQNHAGHVTEPAGLTTGIRRGDGAGQGLEGRAVDQSQVESRSPNCQADRAS